MSDWSDLGLPAPTLPGYGYAPQAGLVRTKMSDGSRWQRVRYPAVRRAISVVYDLTRGELGSALTFIKESGYMWFTTPLVTGDSAGFAVTDHTVRVIANPKTSRTGWDSFNLELALEDRGPPL